MPAAHPWNEIRSTIPFSESPSLLNSHLTASLRRLLPSGIYQRLDPFEATIETFVRGVAAEISGEDSVFADQQRAVARAYRGVPSTQMAPGCLAYQERETLNRNKRPLPVARCCYCKRQLHGVISLAKCFLNANFVSKQMDR